MFSVCSHLGGVPISHNALQHFPECHGAAGGVPISHNALQHFPECHGAAGGAARGGTLSGGVPCLGGVPCPGGSQLGQHREYLLHSGRYASCVHAGGLSCYIYLRKLLLASIFRQTTSNTCFATYQIQFVEVNIFVWNKSINLQSYLRQSNQSWWKHWSVVSCKSKRISTMHSFVRLIAALKYTKHTLRT